MADPLSIFSATTATISICRDVLRFVNSIRTADESFQSLRKQTQSLSEVLDSLQANFRQPLVKQKIKSSQDGHQRYGHEGTYWRSVKQSMDDCRETLQKLERILNPPKRRGIIARMFRGARLVMKKDEIDKYWQEITFYRETMKFVLQWITLASGLRSERLNAQVSSQLDVMLLSINVRDMLEDQHAKAPSLENLRSCVQNAYQLASCASNSVRDGRITQWMSSINPDGDDQTQSVVSTDSVRPGNQRRSTMTSGGTAVSQSKSNIIVWYDGGESAFRSKDYHASRILLGKAYSELELTYPDLEDRILQFNDWQNLLDLLVICQCKLQKYDEAQNTLDSLIQKIQSESIPETLVDAIIKAADVVISSYYKVERLDNAVNLATQIIDIKKNNNNRFALDTQLILAEIYLRQNKIEEAKSRCLEIVAARDSNERAEIDNAADLVLFLIYSKTDNMSEAICKKELLSETYKTFILIDQLCLENPADVLLNWTGTDKTQFIPSGWLSRWDSERKSLLENPSKHRLFILSTFIRFGSTLQVERLLNKWNFMDQIHETQHDGKTVLMVACISGKADIATLFCDCGVDVNRADVKGWTALHYAAGLGHPQIVELLVKHSALINKKTKEGYTPLKVAKRSLLPASCPEQAKTEILKILSGKHSGLGVKVQQCYQGLKSTVVSWFYFTGRVRS